jgi:hypothetical protein
VCSWRSEFISFYLSVWFRPISAACPPGAGASSTMEEREL